MNERNSICQAFTICHMLSYKSKNKKEEEEKTKHLKPNGKGYMQILERCCHCHTDVHGNGEEGMLGCSPSPVCL